MANPGSTDRSTVRTTLRVVGVLLLVVGAAGVIVGAVLFARGLLADDMDSMGRYALIGVAVVGGGGLLAVLGIGALSAGFLGGRTRYVATEALPVVDDSASFLGDDGVLGVGRPDEDRRVE
jgi:hypothetical protein